MDKFLEFWSERAPRERLMLGAGAAVVVMALIYALLIDPPVTGIGRLSKTLPNARAQAAHLDALLGEAKQLKAKSPVASMSATEARGAIEKSLATAGIKAGRIVPLSDGDLQLAFSNVPYATWAAWLAQTERELGARANSVVANATATPGNVDVELALRLARR